MNNEARVISALLKRKDLNSVLNNSPAKLFKSHKDIWDFVYNYYRKHREIPSVEAVTERFSDFEFIDVPDATGHYVDMLRDDRMREEFELLTAGATDALMKDPKNIAKIIKRFEKRTVEIQQAAGESRVLDVKNVDMALEHFDKVRQYRELHDGSPGIMTGFKEMDAAYPTGFAPGHFIVAMGYSGLGKQADVNSLVYDKNGPKRFGDLKVGDMVMGRNGQETRVKGVFPQESREARKITFNDGTSVIVGPEHLWSIQTHKMRQRDYDGSYRTVTTQEIEEKYLPRESNSIINADGSRSITYHAYVPLPEPVEFSEKALPVDPYLLGVYLANGCSAGDNVVRIATNDELVMNRVMDRSPDLSIVERTYESSTSRGWVIHKFRKTLEGLGFNSETRSTNKFIPELYKYASVEQRKELLAGIIDCDISLLAGRNPGRTRPQYMTHSKQLVADVQELVRSLGGTASEVIVHQKPDQKNPTYCTRIWLPFNPFRLPEHRNLYFADESFDYKPMRAIKSIEKVEDRDMQCISVEAEDQLYLMDNYTVTHNTWFAIKLAINAWLEGNSVMFINLEMTPEELRDRILFLVSQYSMNDLIRAEIDLDEFQAWGKDFMNGKADFTLIGNEGFGAFTTSMVQAKIDQYKPNLVIADYLQLFSDSQMSGSEIERAKRTAREFKQLATATNVPIMVITAVTGKDKKDRVNPPDIAQVAWSSEIEYAANMAFAVHTHRDDEGNAINTEIICRKNRHGPLFDFFVNIDFENGSITEIDPIDQVKYLDSGDKLNTGDDLSFGEYDED